jgi:putative transposase
LRREGFAVNHKRLFRISRQERLMVRKRGGRKRALGMRAPMPVPLAPNDRWSLDFVSDQFICGRRFQILAVFDDCTRECLAAIADTSLSGRRVARERDLLIAWRGRPKTVVTDYVLREEGDLFGGQSISVHEHALAVSWFST